MKGIKNEVNYDLKHSFVATTGIFTGRKIISLVKTS